MTGTIETRRLEVAYRRAIRIGYHDLADEIRPKIKPDEGLQKSEIRFLRNLFQGIIDSNYEACKNSELMDGSGECGKYIWSSFEGDSVREFMDQARMLGYTEGDIMQARDEWMKWEHKFLAGGPSDLFHLDRALLDYYDEHNLFDIHTGKEPKKSTWTLMRESGMLVTINEDEL